VSDHLTPTGILSSKDKKKISSDEDMKKRELLHTFVGV
jgi:hypothetical protein